MMVVLVMAAEAMHSNVSMSIDVRWNLVMVAFVALMLTVYRYQYLELAIKPRNVLEREKAQKEMRDR